MDRYRMLPSYRFYDVEGTSPLTLDKSVGKPLRDYKIYGNSIQDGTPSPDNPVEIQSCGDKSKNLFNEELLLKHSGIEKTEDGYLAKQYPVVFNTTQGYDGARAIVDSLKSILKPNVVYTFSRKITNYTSGSVGAITLRHGTQDGYEIVAIPLGKGVKSITFSLTQEQIDSISAMYIYGRADTPSLFEYIQLEEGDTATEYEPYGYKIPIEVGGKNLFNVDGDINRDYKGNPSPNQFHGNHIVSGNQFLIKTSTWATTSFGQSINVRIGKTYTVSLNVIEWGSCPTLEVQLYAINPTALIIKPRINTGENTMTFSFTATTEVVHLAFAQTGISYGDNGLIVGNVQVEEGSTATSYEPYKKEVTNIYLDEPLYKIGNYADYIDFMDGKVVRKNKKIALQMNKDMSIYRDRGSVVTYRTNSSSIYLNNYNKSDTYNIPSMCNKFKFMHGANLSYATDEQGEWLTCAYGSVYVTIRKDRLSEVTNASVTEYVNNLNAELIYALDVPVEQPITLPTIPTHKGTNIISLGTTIQPSNIQIQYYK